MTTIDFEALAEPFPADEIEWRVGNKTKDGRKATLLSYLTSRAVQGRLDDVVGPARWRDAYTPLFEGGKIIGFLCEISIEVEPGKWVGKMDAADVTEFEATKGGISSAFKRAAVKWGCGRYLYGVDSRYHVIHDGYGPDDSIYCPTGTEKKGPPGHILRPTLPASALPKPGRKPKKGDRIDTTPTPEHQQLADEIAASRAQTTDSDGFPNREPPAGTSTAEPLDKAAAKAAKAAQDAARRALHHESFTGAAITSYGGAVSALGMSVDVAAELAVHRGHPRPSAMDAAKRAGWVKWLGGAEGRAAYAAFAAGTVTP